nr:hypothetical protein CFP56_33033 [Quercus suber]
MAVHRGGVSTWNVSLSCETVDTFDDTPSTVLFCVRQMFKAIEFEEHFTNQFENPMTDFNPFEFQEQEFLNENTDFLCQKLSPLFPPSISLDLHPQQQKDLLHEIVSSAHKILVNHYNSNSATTGNNKRWLMLVDLHIFTTHHLSSEFGGGYAANYPLMELRKKKQKFETSPFNRTVAFCRKELKRKLKTLRSCYRA